MNTTYQIRQGRKVLGTYATRQEAGHVLACLLFDHNNLSLVEVRA